MAKKKETVTLDNIKQDLLAALRYKWKCITWWRLGFAIPFSLLALFLCLVPRDFWTTPSDDFWMLPFVFEGVRIGTAILSVAVAVYHLVRYILLYKAHRKKQKAVARIASRADIDVSVEQCGCVDTEWIYEPRIFYSNRWRGNRKKVHFCYFASGKKWRIPFLLRHYEWSKECYLTDNGIINALSREGECFFVTLRVAPDVAYAYPAEIFTLNI
ncbi:MAG: hypothetical protein IJ012_00770 [Clostridia bacterium]|nr:hypothetical protein [Clostridia bacterium]